eukprot:11798871-Ditylum_brightwellii.AAC.1
MDESTIKKHVDLVWASSIFGVGDTKTPDYLATFAEAPTTTDDLEEAKNKGRFKQVMLGKQTWNSLTPSFQLELLTEEAKFKRGKDFNIILLWHTLVNHVNPSTVFSVGNMKDKIEMATMSKFGQNIKLYNSWFTDQRSAIIKEVSAAGIHQGPEEEVDDGRTQGRP